MKQVHFWGDGTLVLGKMEILTPGATGLHNFKPVESRPSVEIINNASIPVVGFSKLGPEVEKNISSRLRCFRTWPMFTASEIICYPFDRRPRGGATLS